MCLSPSIVCVSTVLYSFVFSLIRVVVVSVSECCVVIPDSVAIPLLTE